MRDDCIMEVNEYDDNQDLRITSIGNSSAISEDSSSYSEIQNFHRVQTHESNVGLL